MPKLQKVRMEQKEKRKRNAKPKWQRKFIRKIRSIKKDDEFIEYCKDL